MARTAGTVTFQRRVVPKQSDRSRVCWIDLGGPIAPSAEDPLCAYALQPDPSRRAWSRWTWLGLISPTAKFCAKVGNSMPSQREVGPSDGPSIGIFDEDARFAEQRTFMLGGTVRLTRGNLNGGADAPRCHLRNSVPRRQPHEGQASLRNCSGACCWHWALIPAVVDDDQACQQEPSSHHVQKITSIPVRAEILG
jgi:hypothetical protein